MADPLLSDPLIVTSILIALTNGLLLAAFGREPAVAVERVHSRTR